jgi:RimJ/RimL family protein N-acetyltransferase
LKMSDTLISIHQDFNEGDINQLAINMTSSQEKLDFLNKYPPIMGEEFSGSSKIEDFIKCNADKTWMIKENSSNRNIGFVALEPYFVKYWQLIIYLDKDFSNKGYGGESIKLLFSINASLIKEIINDSTIKAFADNGNVSAQKILEKCGFKLEEDGLRFHVYSYSL